MSKMINIRGKEISEDTIAEAVKKYCNFENEEIPPIRVGTFGKTTDRIFLRITSSLLEKLEKLKNQIVVLDEGEFVSDYWSKEDDYMRINLYSNVRNLGE